MGRATQGVRLINLTKKNDTIASVCKVMTSTDEEIEAEEMNDSADNAQEGIGTADMDNAPVVDFTDGDE